MNFNTGKQTTFGKNVTRKKNDIPTGNSIICNIPDLTGGEKIKRILHSHSKGAGRKLSRGREGASDLLYGMRQTASHTVS